MNILETTIFRLEAFLSANGSDQPFNWQSQTSSGGHDQGTHFCHAHARTAKSRQK
jgi:hypothetical protein